MIVAVHLGWWLLPVAANLAAFTWALWERASERGGFFPHLGNLVRTVVALILSMAFWIAYLLVLLWRP